MVVENKDQTEIDKFSALASRWWDPTSEFKPLPEINPIRLRWIQSHIDLRNKQVLDVGCGGGILSEAMAQSGAITSGIDLSKKALNVADLHSLESQVQINYQCISAEDLANKSAETFDVITCMEMLEHVPDPQSIITACAKLAKPGAMLFFSTLNRNLKSYLMAVIGAEYVLRMLPKGTHDYAKFIKPSELAHFLRDAGLEIMDLTGLNYNPILGSYSLGSNVDVNYLIAVKKPLL